MAGIEQGGYQCPACGSPTTTVRYTVSYETHIMRKRECLKCGYIHETMEVRVDMMEVLNFAYQVTRHREVEGNENMLSLGART